MWGREGQRKGQKLEVKISETEEKNSMQLQIDWVEIYAFSKLKLLNSEWL